MLFYPFHHHAAGHLGHVLGVQLAAAVGRADAQDLLARLGLSVDDPAVATALAQGVVAVDGDRILRRSLGDWLGLSPFAKTCPVEAIAAG